MKYPALDWMIIEAFEQGDRTLARSYWEAVELEREKRGEELADEIRNGDAEFRKFLLESGVINQTIRHLFETNETDEQVRKAIAENNLDKLAKYYNLQNEFNEAYKRHKAVSK